MILNLFRALSVKLIKFLLMLCYIKYDVFSHNLDGVSCSLLIFSNKPVCLVLKRGCGRLLSFYLPILIVQVSYVAICYHLFAVFIV